MTNRQRMEIIGQAKKVIRELGRQQDKIYNQMCRQLKVTPHIGETSNILFDTVYNKYPSPEKAVKEIWPAQDAEKSSVTKSRTT